MVILVRLLMLAGVWFVGGKAIPADPAITRRIEKLSWTAKARLLLKLAQDPRLAMWKRGLVFLPAIYLAFPIDLLPDFVPVLGRLDDAVIFGLAAKLIVFVSPGWLIESHLGDLETGSNSSRGRGHGRRAAPAS